MQKYTSATVLKRSMMLPTPTADFGSTGHQQQRHLPQAESGLERSQLRTMTKETLMRELDRLGITYAKDLTVLELQTLLQKAKGRDTTMGENTMTRKTDPMTGLQALKWATLALAASKLGCLVKDQTRGELMLEIRAAVTSNLQQKYVLGKFKNLDATYDQVLDDAQYCRWAMTVEEPGQLALSKLKALVLICYKGLLKDDMEEAQDLKKPTKKEVKKEMPQAPGPSIKKEESSSSTRVKVEIPEQTPFTDRKKELKAQMERLEQEEKLFKNAQKKTAVEVPIYSHSEEEGEETAQESESSWFQTTMEAKGDLKRQYGPAKKFHK